MSVAVQAPARGVFTVLLRTRKINVPNAYLDMALKDENSVREIRPKNRHHQHLVLPCFRLSNKCGSVGFLSGWRPLRTPCA